MHSDFTHDATPQDHLGVLKLARKYEMDALEKHMKLRLKAKLPSSAEAPLLAPEGFQHYDEDPLLAQAVLDSSINELTPWAFYSLGVHIISVIETKNKSMYDPPSILSTLDRTYIFPLLILQQVISEAFSKWHKQIGEFYTVGCTSAASVQVAPPTPNNSAFGTRSSTKGAIVTPQCSRNSRSLFNPTLLLDLSTEQKQVDPVKLMVPRIKDLNDKMADQSDNFHRKWCTDCIKSLKQIVTNIVLELYPHLVECAARLDCH